MNALDLLNICEQHSVQVELVDAGHISIDPVDRLPTGVLEKLKQYKPDIIAYLSKEPSQQQAIGSPIASNDHVAPDYLPKAHRRALNGFYWQLAQQQERLKKGNYPPSDALIPPNVWRDKVMRVLGCSVIQAEQIERDLIHAGLLAYDNHLKNYLIEGNGLAATKDTSPCDDQYQPSGVTGQDFRIWLYGGNSVH